MSATLTSLDLSNLGIAPGGGRRLRVPVAIAPVELGGQRYLADPDPVDAQLEVSRLHGHGWAVLLRARAGVRGPCVRCLQQARVQVDVEAREVDVPGAREDELASPYIDEDVLDARAWVRDGLVLALPAKILCSDDCAGLCPVCAADLNEAGPEHRHERAPDPRWQKLRELLR
jgi:uncharacterized protein